MIESTTTLAVKASGIVTAVGFNSQSSCMAIHAGISGIRVGNLWDPGAGENISVGRPLTPQWWEGADMLAELAVPAFWECLAAVSEAHPRTVPIFLLLSPLTRPHCEGYRQGGDQTDDRRLSESHTAMQERR